MLKAWIRSWASESPKEILSHIISEKNNRETLLGVLNEIAPSREQIEKDAARFMNYSKSKDYSVFAKEAWSQILFSLDRLMSPDLSDRQVDFYRGKLASTVDLLRVSYLARNAKERFETERKNEALTNNK